ncbi:large conductance mechanosensitive channel protein MscL [Cytobacillus sp. FJAT-54145]|uniref:Large-conductance mechanosensitive channel n=1 Tax=Cytobacillus spartinae TaxID=3299023 RepID=A0ABW6K550_9BACI
MQFFKNFKEFAVRGTVVDMAIGVIVGTAFVKIVDSFVSDIIMPPIGLVLGHVNFSNLYINLSGGHYKTLADAKEAGAVTINYGLFIDSIIHFAIVAFATYFAILQVNRIKKAPAVSMSSKECPVCFSNIPVRAIRCPLCTSDIEETKPTDKKKPEPVVNKLEEEPIRNTRKIKINIKA